MDVCIKLGSLKIASGQRTSVRELRAGLAGGTLEDLFHVLSKRHPDLAPLLEDATQQEDLEISLNNTPVQRDADAMRLSDGDTVSLFVKVP